MYVAFGNVLVKIWSVCVCVSKRGEEAAAGQLRRVRRRTERAKSYVTEVNGRNERPVDKQQTQETEKTPPNKLDGNGLVVKKQMFIRKVLNALSSVVSSSSACERVVTVEQHGCTCVHGETVR